MVPCEWASTTAGPVWAARIRRSSTTAASRGAVAIASAS